MERKAVGPRGVTSDGLARMRDVMAGHVEEGGVPGLAWLVAQGDSLHAGTAGALDLERGNEVQPDSIFRISSLTKPVTAVAALVLIEECRLRLDDPVDALLPELAERRVLARPDTTLDDTVPAQRPVTVRDVLTFRLGHGMDFTATAPQPVLSAMAELGLGSGVPAPAVPPEPDEWIRRLGTLPLAHQPGERWLYHTGADVLGVLVARAAGQDFDDFVRERIFEPLGMVDTGFSVPAVNLDRFGPCYGPDPLVGDPLDPAEGQWSQPPAFPSGADGLVSTLRDFQAFAQMLLADGTLGGARILSRAAVEAMTTNQLNAEQLLTCSPDGSQGWGLGVGVQVRRTGPARSVGTYGWDGGLGSSWANDPAEELVGILLTNQAWTSPAPPAVHQDFWTCAYGALA